mmetsp:Transcript_32946/g.96147  ORF Transcript_32946/g.96147 Transcript_32946/m.96147 type:complete len:223 (-) Transcript_32946:364-1032(-)
MAVECLRLLPRHPTDVGGILVVGQSGRQQPIVIPVITHRPGAPSCPCRPDPPRHAVRAGIALARVMRGALVEVLPLGGHVDLAHDLCRRRALDATHAFPSPRASRGLRRWLLFGSLVWQRAPVRALVVSRFDGWRRLERVDAAIDRADFALGWRLFCRIHVLRDDRCHECNNWHICAECDGESLGKQRTEEGRAGPPAFHSLGHEMRGCHHLRGDRAALGVR